MTEMPPWIRPTSPDSFEERILGPKKKNCDGRRLTLSGLPSQFKQNSDAQYWRNVSKETHHVT